MWWGGEVNEELRKRMVDVCCLQEVRWREQDVRNGGKEVYVVVIHR